MRSIWEMPEAVTKKEIMRRVSRLCVQAKRNACSIMLGNYRTRVPGQGLEFMEARKYVTGESIRQIDWAITARMNEPYVRVFHEEREREVYIALDISPSMHTGWQQHLKIEYAVELAASLAYSVVSSRDKLGFITYSDKVYDLVQPERGEKSFFAMVNTFYRRAAEKGEYCRESDMRQVIHAIQSMRGRRFMIFFISDFLDYDFPDDLRYVKHSHDLSLIHLYDPFEYNTMPELSMQCRSPERDRSIYTLSGQSGRKELEKLKNFLRTESARYRIAFCSLSTAEALKNNLVSVAFRSVVS